MFGNMRTAFKASHHGAQTYEAFAILQNIAPMQATSTLQNIGQSASWSTSKASEKKTQAGTRGSDKTKDQM